MKKKLFVLAALVALIAVVLSAMPVASANSALMRWEGLTSTGALVIGEDCPLVVNSEKLVFDIPHFPEDYYYSSDDDRLDQYDAKVSATYEFENPADYEVTARLAFPFGTTFDYFEDVLYLSDRYAVTVDGAQVEKKVRYSYVVGVWNGGFSATGAVASLKDKRGENGWINADAKVLKVRYKASGAPYQQYELRFTMPERDDVCVITQTYNYTKSDERLEEFGLYVKNGYWYEFAVVYTGEEPEFDVRAMEDGKELDCEITREALETVTLSEYADGTYPFDDESESAKTDWFNIVVDYIYDGNGLATSFERDGGSLFVERHVMHWYEYDLVVPAGGKVVNTVTAPIFPTIDKMYEPSVYEYEYLLSPAKVWAEFGTLDIHINTPYYVLDAEEKGFVKNEDGYSASFATLPDGELTFKVSESADPQYANPYRLLGFFIVATCFAGLIGVVELSLIISFAVKDAKRRNARESDAQERKRNTLRAAGGGFISCVAAGAALSLPSLLIVAGLSGLASAIIVTSVFFALSVAVTVIAVKLLCDKKHKGGGDLLPDGEEKRDE